MGQTLNACVLVDSASAVACVASFNRIFVLSDTSACLVAFEEGAGLAREGPKKVAREVLLDISWYGPAEARINTLYTGILLVGYCHRFGVNQEENH
jgi:hypothetical protein